jgi:hypothetical protein
LEEETKEVIEEVEAGEEEGREENNFGRLDSGINRKSFN